MKTNYRIISIILCTASIFLLSSCGMNPYEKTLGYILVLTDGNIPLPLNVTYQVTTRDKENHIVDALSFSYPEFMRRREVSSGTYSISATIKGDILNQCHFENNQHSQLETMTINHGILSKAELHIECNMPQASLSIKSPGATNDVKVKLAPQSTTQFPKTQATTQVTLSQQNGYKKTIQANKASSYQVLQVTPQLNDKNQKATYSASVNTQSKNNLIIKYIPSPKKMIDQAQVLGATNINEAKNNPIINDHYSSIEWESDTRQISPQTMSNWRNLVEKYKKLGIQSLWIISNLDINQISSLPQDVDGYVINVNGDDNIDTLSQYITLKNSLN